MMVLQDIDPLTDKAYTDLMLPPWPFWRACTAVGLPILLLMLPVNEVSLQSPSSMSSDTQGDHASNLVFLTLSMTNPGYMRYRGSDVYTLQGDNRGDAMQLASLTSKVLGAQAGGDGSLCTFPSSWKVPPSWVVFGEQRAVY